MMKYMLAIAVAGALGLASCQPVPQVPTSNRQIVGPKGSTDIEKPWGGIDQKEGDAILGPLSNARR